MSQAESLASIDLEAFRAKGFPGRLDEGIANVAVRGIDRQQAQDMIRLCPETEAILYGGSFSPRFISYQVGSRPELEKITAKLSEDTPREQALRAMKWVHEQVIHPHLLGAVSPDRALCEEDIINSGTGWCNEQSRVFIALCQVMEIPSRLCFVNHENTVCGHTATEILLENRWCFFDITFGVIVNLPDGRIAEAREISGDYRSLAHMAYRPALENYYKHCQPFVSKEPGWCEADRPNPARGADLLGSIGICNYFIEGVRVSR
ncbi:MAG: transglutaminase domain-containing protein [Chthoniobacterales bacterium]